ncbi:FMN-binding negative transcriptional regulator [Flaviaesturariibacter amylovorans]|uniref:Protease synthase/sporulation negative transcriptional regulator PaiB n=1 Tax=Flaviaesturariibacter amylovorans TaxID=1084520 RepID=A0ABP8GNL2_9BACT
MYNLPYYKEQDPARVLQFIHEHPFAMLIGATPEGRPVATQIPVFIEERDGKLYLSGHMMRKNDHHLAFEANPQVLCVFTGAHTYVSASWYSNPSQGSTWNYRSVHVRGTMRFVDGPGLVDILQKTSLFFEGGNASSATVYENLPEAYTGRLLAAIVGFEVEVEDIQHVFKMSQDRDEASYHNIIGKLKEQDANAQEVARIMEQNADRLFGAK